MHVVTEPVPRFSASRVLAGAFGGAVGGLAFAVLMAGALILRPDTTTPMSYMLARLLHTDNMLYVWSVHLAAATFFGVVFSLLISPRRIGSAVALALAYSVALFFGGAFLALRLATGSPLVFDGPALVDLVGHLVFGLLLGVVYVAFFRQEEDLPHHPLSKA